MLLPSSNATRTRTANFLAHVAVVVIGAAASSCKVPNVLAPQTPVDFCVEQAKAYCALEFRCCTATERSGDPLHIFHGPTVQRRAPSDENECVGAVADTCRAVVDQQNESLQKERIKYDADEASSCLDELNKAVDNCKLEDFLKADGSYLTSIVADGTPGVLGSACSDAIRGNVDQHDTCFAQYECKDGACQVNATSTNPAAPVVTDKGECDGTGQPQNPFTQVSLDIEICDGLADNAPKGG